MKYYVRTTLERTLDESFNQINYELLVDKEHNPVGSFIKQLKIISNEDSVLMEDDIVLCRNFKSRIEKVISEHPNDVINFFYAPTIWFDSYYTTHFLYNQCTYYPKGISKQIAEEMEKDINNGAKFEYDTLENRALCKLGIKTYMYRPCLVQHLDGKSLIRKLISYNRVTPFFVNYLEDLNIDYYDIKTLYDNIDALKEIARNDAKRIRKNINL